MLIVGVEDLLGALTPGVDQCVHQPAWMRVPLRELGIDRGKQIRRAARRSGAIPH